MKDADNDDANNKTDDDDDGLLRVDMATLNIVVGAGVRMALAFTWARRAKVKLGPRTGGTP